MPKRIPFSETTDDTYAQAFAHGCTTEQTRRGYQLSGMCPRCDHQMQYELTTRIVLNGAAGAAGGARPMLCTCEENHPGRPGDDEGCGAYWTVTVSSVP